MVDTLTCFKVSCPSDFTRTPDSLELAVLHDTPDLVEVPPLWVYAPVPMTGDVLPPPAVPPCPPVGGVPPPAPPAPGMFDVVVVADAACWPVSLRCSWPRSSE